MAALPLGKLFGVALKAISKPLATQLKGYAKNSERFASFNIFLGNQLHRFQVSLFRQSYGFEDKARKVKDLPPDKALDVGATFIGESFLFLVAAGVTISEYTRSKAKEARRDKHEREEEERLEKELADAVAERDRKINLVMDTLPILDAKIETLRREHEMFRTELVKSLQLLNLQGPTLPELQSSSDSLSQSTNDSGMP